MLTIVTPDKLRTIVRTAPSPTAIVSWNTRATIGTIDLTVYRADGQVSTWLPYVEFERPHRASRNGRDDVARIETDVVAADAPILAIEVHCKAPLDALAVSTPDPRPAPVPPAAHAALDVPAFSQYLPAFPDERGWCSPATLSMLLAYWGYPIPVDAVARGVYDAAYRGTGNWVFNAAFAGALGLRAAVVHLRGLDHAAHFTAAGIPLALSFAWTHDALPDAPLPASSGHLIVLRGFDAHGDACVNDPAQPARVARYPRAVLDGLWRAHGGVAYALVPPDRAGELVALVNA